MALTQIGAEGLKDDAVDLDSIADDSIDEARLKISNAGSNGQYLQKQSGNTGGLTWADVPAGVGGATGVDFNDDVKIRSGTGNDLEIYHDGSNSYIKNATGDIIFQHGAENLMQLKDDGAVQIYYDNSEKLKTTSSGVHVTGNVNLEGELGLFNGSTNAHRYIDAGLGDDNSLTIRGCEGGDTAHETLAKFTRNGGVDLYHNDVKKVSTTVTGTNHPDGSRVGCGDDDDFYMIHTSDVNILRGTDKVTYIQSDGNILITKNNGTETLAKFVPDGGVELYYDNVKKLETTSAGGTLTGTWTGAGGLDGVTTGSGNVTITDGDLIIGTSGHGISFAATSDGDGTDSSELLDDYEEGTFTPYFHLGSSPGAVTDSGKYSQQDGRYTKIGRFVSATFAVQANNSTSNFDQWTSGDGFIKGWPYPFQGSQPQQVAFCRIHSTANNWGTTYAPYVVYENYSDKAHMQGYNSGGVEPPGNVGNHFGMWGSLQYHTT